MEEGAGEKKSRKKSSKTTGEEVAAEPAAAMSEAEAKEERRRRRKKEKEAEQAALAAEAQQTQLQQQSQHALTEPEAAEKVRKKREKKENTEPDAAQPVSQDANTAGETAEDIARRERRERRKREKEKEKQVEAENVPVAAAVSTAILAPSAALPAPAVETEEEREKRERRERRERRKKEKEAQEALTAGTDAPNPAQTAVTEAPTSTNEKRRPKEEMKQQESVVQLQPEQAQSDTVDIEGKERRRRKKEKEETQIEARSEQPSIEEIAKEDRKKKKKEKKEDEEEPKPRKSKSKKARDPSPPAEELMTENEYQDDFEEYKDDFEDEEPAPPPDKKVLDVLDAVARENSAVKQKVSSRGSSSQSEHAPSATRAKGNEPPPSKPADLPKGNDRKYAKGKTRKTAAEIEMLKRRNQRVKDLMNLVSFDYVSGDIFQQEPMTEYDLYIENFGKTNSVQKSSQAPTDGDVFTLEIQTDKIDCNEVSCQVPHDLTIRNMKTLEFNGDYQSLSLQVDSVSLLKFLTRAAQACESVIEENTLGLHPKKSNTQKAVVSFSSIYTKLNCPLYLKNSPVSEIRFSEAQPNQLLVSHSNNQASSGSGDNSCILIWTLDSPSAPHKVLVSGCVHSNCRFSPDKASIVVAGTRAGSILLWDLREQSNMHEIKDNVTWRYPTFRTDGQLQDIHPNPIVSISTIQSSKGFRRTKGDDGENDESHRSFQMLSLDESGDLNVWVAIELPQREQITIESDVGLSIGGRVKLIKTMTSKHTIKKPTDAISNVQATTIEQIAEDSNTYLIGTTSGRILHGSRFGQCPPPKFYQLNIENVGEVTSVSSSPFFAKFFLVSSSDGSIALFKTNNAAPVNVWFGFTESSVTHVCWSPTKPSVFFACDSSSRFFIWSLFQPQNPVIKEDIKSGDGHLTGFAVSNRSPVQEPSVAFGFSNGAVEIHELQDAYADQKADELEKIKAILDGF